MQETPFTCVCGSVQPTQECFAAHVQGVHFSTRYAVFLLWRLSE